ncbi:MAG: protein-glutamate O-methyltransferase CheR [Pseudomonadota bacterium]
MIVDTQISPKQFQKFSSLVYSEAGILLNENKFELLKARLAKRMRTLGITRVSDYIDLMDNNADEFMNFIDAITTNHTFFFRENKHCDYIIQTLEKRQPLKIWSAASSSGEEAYSLAVQLHDSGFKFSIYASDISDSMLNLAVRAIYSMEKMKSVPLPILHRYFKKGHGKWQGHVQVKPEIRSLVQFGKYNLLSNQPFDLFDIIFCRNVMIYFDSPTKQRVIDNLQHSLKPGGHFFVGMSESLQGLTHSLIPITPSGYRRK